MNRLVIIEKFEMVFKNFVLEKILGLYGFIVER